jgi:DNA-binding MarR family transcriptional regulator
MIPKKIREAVQQGRITPANAYVYLVLREFAGGGRSVKIMRSVLADATGYACLESVSEHLKKLVAAGLIEVRRSQSGGNEHILEVESDSVH